MKIHAAILLFLIAGCNNPARVDETVLRIETNSLVYSRGDSLTISVANVGSASVIFGPCPVIVERSLGTSWHGIATLPGRAPDDCDAIRIELKAGQTQVIHARLDPQLDAGTYRVQLPSMRRMSDAVALGDPNTVSNAFTVN